MWKTIKNVENIKKNSTFWEFKEQLDILKSNILDTTLYESTLNKDEVGVWVAPEIPQEKRMQRLFPNWIPKKENEMSKYLKKVNLLVLTAEWKSVSISLRVHKKLSNEIISIFQELYDKKIYINPKEIWCYNWRPTRNNSKPSIHSYWAAIDINTSKNKWEYGTEKENEEAKNNPYYITDECVDIWKSHGFYRWNDRVNAKKDPMHFSYTEKPDPVELA